MNLFDPKLRRRIGEFCSKWQIREFALFGSVLTDSFGPQSDVDVLLTYSEQTPLNLRSLYAMEQELRGIFGRDVDVVSRRAIEECDNPVRKKLILEQSQTLFAA